MRLVLCKTTELSKFLYTIFLGVYEAAFKVAAVFNAKARAGVEGRKSQFKKIHNELAYLGSSRGSAGKVVWMHCASLGEFEQGRPLAEAIRKSYPGYRLVLTFFSASGYQAMKHYEGADHVLYLPFDGERNARELVNTLNPALVLWVKYEYWYYYLRELKRRQIPVFLVSGIFREDQPFFKWYGSLWKEMLLCFRQLFLQNEASVTLLNSIGITNNVSVTGDTRFDRVIEVAEKFTPVKYVDAFCGNSKVIVAGSTWEDDEAELTHYVKANPAIKFIIAPHEIDEANLQDVKKEFPTALFYSQLVQQISDDAVYDGDPGINVLIIDNVGMLSRLYSYADITYVGGGFGVEGVHNVLEAAVYGKPVLFGPEFEKYAEATDLVEKGAAIPIANALELEKVLTELWNDDELLKNKGATARRYVYEHVGARKKILEFIQENRLLTN